MCWSFFLHQFLLLLCQYFVFLYSSMTASPTATNHAMLSSSGPKVTARGCCHPTDLSATLEKTECCVMSELSNPAPHTMRTLSVTQQESFHHNVADCCTGNVLQPLLFAHAVPSLAFSVFTPHPMTPPPPLPSPGVNTGGVGSYIYEKEPSAVTQPWTFVILSLIPLLYTTLTINHSIICRPPWFFFSFPARFLSFLFILTRCQQIFFAPWGMITKNYLDMCVFSAPGESPHPALPTWLLYVITHHPKDFISFLGFF